MTREELEKANPMDYVTFRHGNDPDRHVHAGFYVCAADILPDIHGARIGYRAEDGVATSGLIDNEDILSLHGPGPEGRAAAEHTVECFGMVGKFGLSQEPTESVYEITDYFPKSDQFGLKTSIRPYRWNSQYVFEDALYPTRAEAETALAKQQNKTVAGRTLSGSIKKEQCPTCGGSRWVESDPLGTPDNMPPSAEPCPDCGVKTVNDAGQWHQAGCRDPYLPWKAEAVEKVVKAEQERILKIVREEDRKRRGGEMNQGIWLTMDNVERPYGYDCRIFIGDAPILTKTGVYHTAPCSFLLRSFGSSWVITAGFPDLWPGQCIRLVSGEEDHK